MAQGNMLGGFEGGLNNYMNMLSNPWYQGMMGLGGLAGGIMGQQGADQLGNQIQQGMNQASQYADQGLGYLQPWQTAGQNALGQYQAFNQQFANPTQAYNNIFNSYQMSPQAQFQMQQMQQQMNNSAADSGTLGSPAEQKGMMNYAQGIVSNDQQNYLQNILGIGNMYSNNLNNLMGQGLGAAGQMNQNRMNLGNNLAQMYQNLGMAQMYGNQSMGSGLGGLLGGLGGLASSLF